MKPLFASPEEKLAFQKRHEQASAELKDITQASGDCFFGLDAGSTTTKAVLIDGEG